MFQADNTRTGFSIIEVLLTLGILTIMAAVTLPMYRNYTINSELNATADEVLQSLHRAKLLSELNEHDAGWGVAAAEGVLFQGGVFASHSANFDEVFGIPETITVTGLLEVSFEKLTGSPSATGTIILTAINGAERRINILGPGTIVSEPGDRIEICHIPQENPENAHTVRIPDSAWPAHQAHGDTMGPCSDDDDDDE